MDTVYLGVIEFKNGDRFKIWWNGKFLCNSYGRNLEDYPAENKEEAFNVACDYALDWNAVFKDYGMK